MDRIEDALTRIDTDLWTARRPLRLFVGDVGTRMTVVRLASGELWLHSPVPLDAATRAALDALGPVRWVVGPSRVHHFYLGDYAGAYARAELCGAPGLARKRRDLRFAHELGDGPPPWGDEIRMHVFGGAPGLSEVVCFHPKTRTLVLTDLAFNLEPGARDEARLFHRLVGASGRFGPHRIIRLAIRDRAAARRSLERILAWDFDRVIVAHGEILGSGGRDRLAASFGFLGAR
jgi:hypothetical protein